MKSFDHRASVSVEGGFPSKRVHLAADVIICRDSRP